MEGERDIAPLLRASARDALHGEGDGILSVLSPEAHAGRFEGLYGPLYDRTIQSRFLRRFASLAYGDAGPIPDLDAFARRVAAAAPGVLLDVPSGGGTMVPLLRRAGYDGLLVESDLGAAMLRRAARHADDDTVLLRADAQDMPFADGAVDAVVSLNGLHCMPDPHAFVRELGRVVRPGGRLFLVTLVSGGTRRADLSILAGRISGIVPTAPPPRATLLRWLRDAGWSDIGSLGGKGLTGYEATRR